MSGLPLILTPEGRAALVNAENTGTSGLLVSHVGISASGTGVVGGVLQGEITRLTTFAGSVVSGDTIHVTIRDDSTAVYSLRAFALYLEDGTLLAWYSQAGIILEKSAQAMLLLSADMQFQNLSVTSLEFGDSNWTNPIATTSVYGVLRLATNEAVIAGASVVDAVTPAGLLASLNARFGAGAPSAFVKGLLGIATAALFRAAIGLGSASVRNEGAGGSLDADLLDGQHGAYYLHWDNQTNKPNTFPPAAHGHAWGELSGVPATASRWPTYDEVTGKPASYPPSAHAHAAADVTSGTFHVDRIPELAQAKITGLATALAAAVRKDVTLNSIPAATADWRIAAGSAEGSDVLALRLQSGGAFNTARGAILELNGANAAANAGGFRLLGVPGTASQINGGTGSTVSFLSSTYNFIGALQKDGADVWHPGNFTPTNVPTQTGDLLVTKASAIVGVGVGGGRNGGVANYAVAGVGDVGLFSEYAAGRVRLRPDGRLSVTGEFSVTTTGMTWNTNEVWHAGNFTPGSKLNTSGGTLTGSLTISPTAGNSALFFTTAGGVAGSLSLSASLNTMVLGTTTNHALTFYVNGVLRGTYTTSGTFLNESGVFASNAASAVLATVAAGTVYLRPNGTGSAVGQMQLASTGNMTINGICVATGGFGPASSRKVKRDLVPLPYGLAEIEQVDVQAGFYRDDYNPDGRRRLFVITEQLKGIIPEAVLPGVVNFGEEAVDAADYMQLVPVLIKAVQELSAKVRELQAR